jgi:hypothetical protein
MTMCSGVLRREEKILWDKGSSDLNRSREALPSSAFDRP